MLSSFLSYIAKWNSPYNPLRMRGYFDTKSDSKLQKIRLLMWWFKRKWPPKKVALLGGVALLGWVWSCWRKPNSVQVGFEVSYTFMLCPVSQTTYYCLLVNI